MELYIKQAINSTGYAIISVTNPTKPKRKDIQSYISAIKVKAGKTSLFR